MIIEISGKCQEPIVIQRDKVTLRGSDPLLDGIKALAIDPFYPALVTIDGGQNVKQSVNLGTNLIRDDSTLILDGTEFIGQTTIETFANGQALNNSTLGELDCNSGGVFFCDGSESKGVSTCGLCP